jgi:hypothetical protein
MFCCPRISIYACNGTNMVRYLCFAARASRYMHVMGPTWCTIYVRFIPSLCLYMFRVVGCQSSGGKDKRLSIPITGLWGPDVSGRLRLPDSVTSAVEDGWFLILRTGRIYPQEYPGTHFDRLSRPRARGIVGCHCKNPHWHHRVLIPGPPH